MAKIERDESYERDYIPMPGGWEVQTKGRGSSFRIADTKCGRRLNIPDSPYLFDLLERMARDVFAAHEAVERELAAYKQAAEEFENEHWEGGQIEARAASILAANARD